MVMMVVKTKKMRERKKGGFGLVGVGVMVVFLIFSFLLALFHFCV